MRPTVERASLRTAAVTATAVHESPAALRPPSSLPLNSVEVAEVREVDALHGFISEARYQLGGSLNESNAKVVGSSGRDAYALGAYWQFNSSLAAGIEAGNESFDQTLRYRNSDTLQIDQRPSYFWGGLSLRYYLGALPFADLSPYLQTTFGGTIAGPVLRFRLGTQYELSSNLSATLSGEFSSLFYTFDSVRFTSGRWGLSGGVQYTIR